MKRARTGEPAMPRRTVATELPGRALLFLRGSGTHSGIRAVLGRGGFREADHREGWDLLTRVCAWEDSGLDPTEDEPAREARDRIAAFVHDHFPRLRAAIEREHPELVGVFDFGAVASTDPVLLVGQWLERVAALPRRRRANLLATLTRRGVSEAVRRNLGQDVTTAMQAAVPATTGPVRAERGAEIAALYQWYSDWGATARALIKRKDWLVVLGLSQRERS
jgi:hypothetical protein